ncbi:transcriptional repressor LexA [Insolitispirillum peregrinum]
MRETGISPSFDEMKDALDLKSKSGIHRLVTALEERGFIRRLAHRARAIEILRLPENTVEDNSVRVPPPLVLNAEPLPIHPPAPDARTVVRGQFGSAPRAIPDETLSLPLFGRIAAGTPIEALRDGSATVDIPAAMVGKGKHYCLTIEGDSMIEAGILDGDTVVIRECQTAENGTIVVALVDGQEATLKRIRRKGNTVALEPANRAYETRLFGPDRVAVQGQLVGLIRQYVS